MKNAQTHFLKIKSIKVIFLQQKVKKTKLKKWKDFVANVEMFLSHLRQNDTCSLERVQNINCGRLKKSLLSIN